MTIDSVIRASRGSVLATVICLAAYGLDCALPASHAAGPRVLPVGQLPTDVRLGPLKDLDGYFPFVVPSNVEAWQQRADSLRTQSRAGIVTAPR